MIDLGLLATGLTHEVKVEQPRLFLQLRVFDPAKEAPVPLPAGVLVRLVRRSGVATRQSAMTDAQGRVRLVGSAKLSDVSLRIDFDRHDMIDLDAGTTVAGASVKPNDTRRLLRMPRRWHSHEQSKFSDDRGGAFAKGRLATLVDGELGTEAEPWVLDIDAAWTRVFMELRYANTVTGAAAPMPAGPLVEAFSKAGTGPSSRVAAATVLSGDGLLYVAAFDEIEPSDLRIRFRCARFSRIAMNEKGADAALTVVRPKDFASRPAAERARMRTVARTLWLHELVGSLGGKTDTVGKLLSTPTSNGARIVINLDAAVELQLQIADPRAASVTLVPLPAGPVVSLVDGAGDAIGSAEIVEDGRATVHVPAGMKSVALTVDFEGREYIDLDANAYVDASTVTLDGHNEPRPLVRLPAQWESRAQDSLSDDRGGAVKDGVIESIEPGTLGTSAAPWVLRIDHAWPRVEARWTYYDVDAQVVSPVPPGAVVEVFRGPKINAKRLIGAASAQTADGAFRIPLFGSADDADVRLRFRTAVESHIELAEADPLRKMQVFKPGEFRKQTLAVRLGFYSLPSLWLSANQLCTAGGTAALVEQQLGGAISATPTRLEFDLDDLVLVDKAGRPIRMRADEDELTFFHRDFSIREPNAGGAPDPAEAYFSRITSPNNQFAGAHATYVVGQGVAKTTRVVRRGKRFFDLKRRRTTRGSIIGARAAIRDDHPHEHIFLKHDPGTLPHLVNVHVHYFRNIALDTTGPKPRVVSVLLVYVGFRLRKARVKVTDADLAAIRESLTGAAQRWNQDTLQRQMSGAGPQMRPDIRVEAQGSPHDAKLVFHFVALRTGAPQMRMLVSSRPGGARPFAFGPAGLMLMNTQFAGITGTLHSPPFASFSVGKHTLAHELGHVLGLADEYFEELTNGVPRLNQPRWGATHLSFDGSSIMYDEYIVRLRHYWPFALWLEQQADIPEFSSGDYVLRCDETRITGASPSARNHAYALPPAHPWPYNSVSAEPKWRNGHGRGDLALFLLGDDVDPALFSRGGVPVTQAVDAVLHLKLKVHVRFVRNANGDKLGRGTPRMGMIARLAKAMRREMGGLRFAPSDAASAVSHAFILERDATGPASSPAVDRVLLYVLPLFTRANPGPADFHLRVRPEIPGGGADNVGDLHATDASTVRLDLTDDTPAPVVLRYMLGLPHRTQASIDVTSAPITLFDSLRITTRSNAPTGKRLTAVHPAAPGGVPVAKDEFDGSSADPAEIARRIADAINDKGNSFAAQMKATASGSTVQLSPLGPATDLALDTSSSHLSVQGEFIDTIEADDLGVFESWLGSAIGGRFVAKKLV